MAVSCPTTHAEAIARNNGQNVTIHSGPSTNDRAIGTLYDGQRVTLSGQYQNDWAELADGGWVSTHHLAQAALRQIQPGKP